VIEKSGSWFSYDSQRIGQGRENAKAYLKEHPEVAAAIESAIRAQAGLTGGEPTIDLLDEDHEIAVD
jgi:recombination protein RecA